jgi:hypothetical protein
MHITKCSSSSESSDSSRHSVSGQIVGVCGKCVASFNDLPNRSASREISSARVLWPESAPLAAIAAAVLVLAARRFRKTLA